MGKWVGNSGFWLWTPFIEGPDDPSEPCPEMVVIGPGPEYFGLGGHKYPTTTVKAPHALLSTQDIVNWKANLNPDNPYLEYYKSKGIVPEAPAGHVIEEAESDKHGEPVEGRPDILDWSVALTGIKQEGFWFDKDYDPIKGEYRK